MVNHMALSGVSQISAGQRIRETKEKKENRENGGKKAQKLMPVSYTHLDVYKRQLQQSMKGLPIICWAERWLWIILTMESPLPENISIPFVW